MIIPVFIYDHSKGIGEGEAFRYASAAFVYRLLEIFTPPPHSLISAYKESYLHGRFQQACAIKLYPKKFSTTTCIAIESTNTYHELFVEIEILAKYTIYIIDAYRLSRYHDAVAVRAKTDSNDAH